MVTGIHTQATLALGVGNSEGTYYTSFQNFPMVLSPFATMDVKWYHAITLNCLSLSPSEFEHIFMIVS